jgi:hypothetical protein
MVKAEKIGYIVMYTLFLAGMASFVQTCVNFQGNLEKEVYKLLEDNKNANFNLEESWHFYNIDKHDSASIYN